MDRFSTFDFSGPFSKINHVSFRPAFERNKTFFKFSGLEDLKVFSVIKNDASDDSSD